MINDKYYKGNITSKVPLSCLKRSEEGFRSFSKKILRVSLDYINKEHDLSVLPSHFFIQ